MKCLPAADVVELVDIGVGYEFDGLEYEDLADAFESVTFQHQQHLHLKYY